MNNIDQSTLFEISFLVSRIKCLEECLCDNIDFKKKYYLLLKEACKVLKKQLPDTAQQSFDKADALLNKYKPDDVV